HRRDRNCEDRDQSQVLSPDEVRAMDRTREEEVQSLALHLAKDQLMPHEDGDQTSEERDSGQSQIERDAPLFSQRQRRKEPGRSEEERSESENQVEHLVAQRLLERVQRQRLYRAHARSCLRRRSRKTLSRSSRFVSRPWIVAPARRICRRQPSTCSGPGSWSAIDQPPAGSARCSPSIPWRRSAGRAPSPVMTTSRTLAARSSSASSSSVSRPFDRSPTRSTRFSTSARTCVLRSSVRPAARSRRSLSLTSPRATGSRPLIGSSRMSSSGSCTRHCASPTRWSCPFESLLILR